MEPITTLNDAELEEIFERSSGPGGQNVNKTSTKVTLRHLPTGVSVTVQDTRSQFQNRALARERLLTALNQRREERQRQERSAREKIRRQKRPRPARIKAGILREKRKRSDVKKQRSMGAFND
jgi:protein subunit release factor B